MKDFLRVAQLTLYALLSCSTLLIAQTDLGSISGHVRDQQSHAVSGAWVRLRNPDTNFDRTVQTDSSGNYSFIGIPLTGQYVLTVNAPQFTPAEQKDILLRAQGTAVFDFTLAVSGMNTQVNVYGTTGTVPVESNQVSTRLSQEKIEDTPVVERKITTLPLLNSSVRPSQTTGDLFLNETLFVINGTGRRQTTYELDNTTANDMWGRQSAIAGLPFSAVQEFTIYTNASSAEWGWNAGTAVNIVTRSGSNDWHGDFVGMGSPEFSNASIPLAVKPAQETYAQGSGMLSGPIVKDKTYFMVSGQYTNQNRPAVITSPLENGTLYNGTFSQTLFLARLDQQLSENNRLTLRANFDRFSDTNPQDAVSGVTLPTAARVFTRNTYQAAITDTAVINSNTLNDARFEFLLGDPITQFVPVTPGPQLFVSGFYTYGESRMGDLANHQYEYADTLSLSRGRHQLKFGFDVINSSSGGFGQEFGSGYLDGRFQINAAYKLIPITTLLNFNPGLPPPGSPPGSPPIASSFTQSFGNQSYNIRDTLYGAFAQDNWRILPNLTLNLGLRWDGETFTNQHALFAPRVGLAWKLPNSDTVIRAGYGIYYSEERTDLFAGAAIGGPLGAFTYTAAPGGLGFPTSFAPIPAFPPGAILPARDITILPGQCNFLNQFLPVSRLHFCDNNLQNPYTQQWNLGFEHDLGSGWLLSLDYIGSHTIHIEQPVDLNAPAPFIRTRPGQTRSVAAANATRPIVPVPGGFRQVLQYINAGSAWYDGLQVGIRKQLSRRLSALLTYTWSHDINTVEWDGTGQNPNDYGCLVACEKATSLLNQTNRVSASATYQLPLGFMISGWVQAASGFPFNVTTGVDNNGDGNTSDRPVIDGVVIPRNAGQAPATSDVDLALQKSFHITERSRVILRAESFNTFNHLNLFSLNGVFGNGTNPVATFGMPVGGLANVGSPRLMQFMARIVF
ncbi:MAG TPA: TonB-dependent receptor [Candidatus Binatia bacterium]|nr:TonB-dependent receptor [Candidatus Binatia bacterium]